jgi:1,4-dihydroxy-2-naphthoate octaprenyltransferase
MILRHIAAFVALGRPLFLAGGAVFYGLGVAAALYDGAPLRLGLALWGYLAVAAAQLMNHYSNDYFDLDADVANTVRTRWAGGSRVLADGLLPPRAALWAAAGFGALAVALALAVAAAAPAPLATLALLLGATALAWVYSGPPLHLHRRGLGEPVGALVIVGLTAATGYLLQAGRLGAGLLLALVPLCLLQLAMLIAVSVPDAVGDAAVGKGTLVVRLGLGRAAGIYAAAVALAYAALPALALAGLPWPVALAPLGAAPIAAWNLWRALRGVWAHEASWEGLGFWSIGQLVASAGLMLLGFVWAS